MDAPAFPPIPPSSPSPPPELPDECLPDHPDFDPAAPGWRLECCNDRERPDFRPCDIGCHPLCCVENAVGDLEFDATLEQCFPPCWDQSLEEFDPDNPFCFPDEFDEDATPPVGDDDNGGTTGNGGNGGGGGGSSSETTTIALAVALPALFVIALLIGLLLWREMRRNKREAALREMLDTRSTTQITNSVSSPPSSGAKPRDGSASTLQCAPGDTWARQESAYASSTSQPRRTSSTQRRTSSTTSVPSLKKIPSSADAELGSGTIVVHESSSTDLSQPSWLKQTPRSVAKVSAYLAEAIPGFGARPKRRKGSQDSVSEGKPPSAAALAGGQPSSANSLGEYSAESSLSEGFVDFERVKLLGHGTHGRAVLLRSSRTGEMVVAKEVPIGHVGGAAGIKARCARDRAEIHLARMNPDDASRRYLAGDPERGAHPRGARSREHRRVS